MKKISHGAFSTNYEDDVRFSHFENRLSNHIEEITRLHKQFKSDEFKQFSKDFRIVSKEIDQGARSDHVYDSLQQKQIADVITANNYLLCQDSRDVWVLQKK